MTGTVVDGRYRADAVLGQGGFATVYRGTDTETGREVAIKVLDGEIAGTPQGHARFEREVDAISRLHSPNTVRLFSHGRVGRYSFIVFELVPGMDLSTLLEREGPLDAATTTHILRQVLGSLAEAHAAGVLHRDIKPTNIRVFRGEDGAWVAKVLDFGVARFTDPTVANLTKTGELVGTPRYMSPEQLLGEPLGPASDIYAAGIVALEMLVGSAALHGPRLTDQIDRLESGYYFSASAIQGSQLQRVVERMTSRRLEQRYQSAHAVLRALEPEEPAPPPPPARGETAAVQTPATPDGTSARPPWGWIVAFAVVLGLGVAIGAVASRTEPDAPPPEAVQAREPAVVPPPTLAEPAEAPRPAEARDAGAMAAAPTGCAAAPDWRGRKRFTVKVAGGVLSGSSRRDFYIYLPRAYDATAPRPVVMLFQTLLQDAATIVAATGAEELADEHGFIVLSFDRPNEGVPWNDRDVEFVASALQRTSSVACVDPDRLYGVGHGVGAEFIRSLACSARFAAIAAAGDVVRVEGRACAIEPPVPFLRIAGRQDAYVPIRGGKSCLNYSVLGLPQIERQWRTTNVCGEARTTWRKEKAGTCSTWDCETPFVSCEVDGGHNWPRSVPPPIEMPSCVADPPTFPMMETIWAFFAEQRPEVTAEP